MEKNTLIGLAVALLTMVFVFITRPADKESAPVPDDSTKQHFSAVYGSPLLDGKADDAVWQQATWYPLDQVWIGAAPSAADFTGRYACCWDEGYLYLLAEITDDTLIDIHPDGLLKYWDDDCLEVFLDEDASGGEHQYNYNAFAYHIALDGKVVDIRPDSAFAYFNEHCTTRRVTNGHQTVWEVAIKLYDGKTYNDAGENIPRLLKAGKKIGFALAYCDNDHSAERENFIGSVRVEGADKNRGWIDAGIFGVLEME